MTGAAVSSPHAHAGSSVRRLMLLVCGALLPCTLFGFYLFGWPAIWLFGVTVAVALLTELGCLYALGAPLKRVVDGSALLTGWLIALTLPPWAPWWIGALGAFFAIAVGKQLYGGLGQNVFNPAMLARVALLIAFPLEMTTWTLPTPLLANSAPGLAESLAITFAGADIDGYTGATALGALHTGISAGGLAGEVLREHFDAVNAGLGLTAGSLGETSELLVLLGGLFLLWRRLIPWEIPLSLLAVLGLAAQIGHTLDAAHLPPAMFYLGSGGVFLGAFFIATDPVTCPVGRLSRCLYGAGIGLVIYIIRAWGSFPEGVAFAVLFGNAFTPLLDRYFRPRRYGRDRRGAPLAKPDTATLLKDAQR